MRRWFLALLFVITLAPYAQAYTSSRNDVDTPAANAAVWVSGCTGTLIAPQLVITAGHCGSGDPTGRTEVDGTFVPTGEWARLATPFDVRVGADPNAADTAHRYTAIFFTQAGWADIEVIMLDRPVPAAQATPVRPLTRLSAAQSAIGFWGHQSFTVAGYGGTHPVRQTANFSTGIYPCKTAPIIANREFICPFEMGGVDIEGGDSGGPLFWTDPTTRTRYVIGATQGNVQFLRRCSGPTDGSHDTSHCSTPSLPKLSAVGAAPCQSELALNVNLPAWNPWHYTTTFFTGGQCWTDRAGATRHEPNIAAWFDDVLLWAPTASDRLMPIVQQRATGVTPRLDIAQYDGDNFATTIATAKLLNPHAPNVWSSPAIQPLWRWQVAGSAQPVFLTELPGHKFSRPTWNGLTLSNPSLIGYLWFGPTDAPNLAPMDLYSSADGHQWLTTWNLAAAVPDSAARARWTLVRHLGYVQVPPLVFRPIPRPTPLPLPGRP